jgi:hypothetical protein
VTDKTETALSAYKSALKCVAGEFGVILEVHRFKNAGSIGAEFSCEMFINFAPLVLQAPEQQG